MRRIAILLAAVTAVAIAACDDPTMQPSPDASCFRSVNQCQRGTVRYYPIEGGFWAVRGDDSVTYDPMNGLPEDFQQDGLRVTLVFKPRQDLVGYHQVGPIVEVISISRISDW